jgi:hypothetical protein
MNRTTLQVRLAIAERHVAQGREHLEHQHEIIARLEGAGCSQSETANVARDLLHQMERQLDGHLAECDWLREQLQK